MPAHVFNLLGLNWVIAAALMVVVWAWHLRLKNAAVVDVGWAGGLALVALVDALVGRGDPRRRWLAGLMMAVWGARLALYLLLNRVVGHAEDARYAELRRAHGPAANKWFFWFFQAQALLVALLSWPVLVAAGDPRPDLSLLVWLGAGVWIVAVAGETLADAELSAFKRDPAHRGHTCQNGLWRYSRHPNYFFEWLVWIGYALVALPSPGGWLSVLCPMVMLYLLFRVTGIPATEAQAIRTKGDEYREYQRTTSAFVPWFRRS